MKTKKKNYFFRKKSTSLEIFQKTDPETGIEYKEELQRIYKVVGGNSNDCYLMKKTNLLFFNQGKQKSKFYEYPRITPNKIIKISSGSEHILILDQQGIVYSINRSNYQTWQMATGHNKNKKIRANKIYALGFFLENELFVHDITCGSNNSYFLCSRRDNKKKIFLDQNQKQKQKQNANQNQNQNLNDPKNKKKNCNSFSLYSCGRVKSSGVERFRISIIFSPEKVSDNVSHVFSGNFAYHFWYLTTNNTIMGAGENIYSQLGIDFDSNILKPKRIRIKHLENDDIQDLKGGYQHSLLLTNRGELYGTGKKGSNGLNRKVKEFTKIETLSDAFVYQMAICEDFNLILTDQGVYYWGEGDFVNKELESRIPKKLKVSQSIDFGDYDLSNSRNVFYLIQKEKSSIIEDFADLFESKQLCNDKISGIPVHKLWVETRIGRPLNQFKKWIKEKNFNQNEILDFLKWIYSNTQNKNRLSNSISNLHHLKLFFNGFMNNNELINTTVNQSLIKLYKNEKSKNFFIQVKVFEKEKELEIEKQTEREIKKEKEKEKENENEKETEKERKKGEYENNVDLKIKIKELQKGDKDFESVKPIENYKNKKDFVDHEEKEEKNMYKYEEIAVHDFVLFARSGLYRAFFDFIQENQITNKIQDYSSKSIQTLKIFIKFLYYDRLVITNENKSELILIIEELSDAVEYYQLNIASELLYELNRIKKELRFY
ncbi:hypothetical protein M0812_08171 [Anaeramoeba flamelloides]|uniref:BTB domain-containing protein n=1 Tax=Anaeramoeba flamelloides TaxID=1746091 RepID=A0AAV8A273_9EUKA|nr:hypothetical protein M0812_08171 [Anaeramoeba flamelloides]